MLPAPALPPFLSLAFGLTTALTVGLLYYAARRSGRTLLLVLVWAAIQTGLALNGFYTMTTSMPPRLALALGPPVLLLLLLLGTARGRAYLDSLRLDVLTLLHVVRLPVELVLLGLFLHRAVPRLMTFEGRNWDILMGLSAPLVYYFSRTPRIRNVVSSLEFYWYRAAAQYCGCGRAVGAFAGAALRFRAAQRSYSVFSV